ncbi:PTEN induced putative kinase 1 [Tolypothrix sp. PCC 7601]|nr:PTEN induced putative kinase 1 [Tolypothrix sp. PCC 7601]
MFRKFHSLVPFDDPKRCVGKPARKSNWGNKLLAGLDIKGGKRRVKPPLVTTSPASPNPSSFPQPDRYQVRAIADKFIRANQVPGRTEREL